MRLLIVELVYLIGGVLRSLSIKGGNTRLRSVYNKEVRYEETVNVTGLGE